MNTSTTMLTELTPQSDCYTIHVRVTRIWEAINKHNGAPLHTNILLLDQQGNHIVAIIRNNQKHLFLPMIEENEVYKMSKLKVVQGPKLYRTADMDNVINFFYKTKIKKELDTGIIPKYKFELQDFASVAGLVGNVKVFIDVIGMVKSYGQLERRSNGAQKMDIILNNVKLEEMLVTLWEDRAKQFQDGMAQASTGPLFVVITGLIAKKFSGTATLSSSDATRTFFNIDYTPLDELKEAMSTAMGKDATVLAPPLSEKFVTTEGKNVPHLTINSILEIKVEQGKEMVRCICRARIKEILNGNGWYYTCCPKCARTVRPLEGRFYCLTCAQTADPVSQRFRIVARVEDTTGSTTLTLFNKEVEQLVGVPLPKILQDLGQDGNKNDIPPPVNNIIGKLCVFQIKVTTYNTTHGSEEYTVTRVSEDTDTEASNTAEKHTLSTCSDPTGNLNKRPKLG